ncbi:MULTISPECIES: hypothetical protein [Thermoactinomyces]|uniref:Uncharacterized protein n=1 Tax=Thermoactinomyces daqus TaxID=1329516 RepID=A0A7W2AJK8_9BACL|nr:MULTISPECIES: hypothetical protein [Thermoactinomyces]MBA4543973.1 hypothetical protein [Thermoactinomyces daqus]MBH8599094.1 hypothetical protein [Thermoactinomyces sp. CICC 10523]MBH8607975.1 hypothetical protein [Thermoactinomyces sp. CICC 10521]
MTGFHIPPITTDEQYVEYLERIVKGAQYLENPLIKPEDYAKGMKLYDALCERVLQYGGDHLNRWHVYNWLKYRFLNSNVKPARDEVLSTFPELSPEEIDEGIAEFENSIRWKGVGNDGEKT